MIFVIPNKNKTNNPALYFELSIHSFKLCYLQSGCSLKHVFFPMNMLENAKKILLFSFPCKNKVFLALKVLKRISSSSKLRIMKGHKPSYSFCSYTLLIIIVLCCNGWNSLFKENYFFKNCLKILFICGSCFFFFLEEFVIWKYIK